MFSGSRLTPPYRHAALIRVTGEDAAGFLQGQFTNELRQETGSATYGLWLNQKGRVLADSHALRLAQNEFLVTSACSTAAVIRQRLEDYIIADDVVLHDETDTAHGFTLWGEGSEAFVGELMGAAPAIGKFVGCDGVLAFRGRWLPGESWVFLGSEARLAELKARLAGRVGVEVDRDEMNLSRILAGIPGIPQDIGPGDLPNEGGLDESAISYTKGCYLGQEVMARLKNLGQVRRRLHVVCGPGAAPAVLASLYQGEKKVGEIRSAAARGGEFAALAMLSLVNFDPKAGLSLTANGPAVIALHPHG
jgi:tRNA-modifying protein YgfZ